MTLHRRDQTTIPGDIAALGQRLLAPDDPYRVLGDRLAELVDDAAFARLYEETGRAAIPPSVLALVTLFQFIEEVPDREAARLLVMRLDWKYALHLALANPGFNFSCLSYFRQRLLAPDQERLVFWLLDHLAATAPAALRELAAVGVLRMVWAQRYTREAGRTQVRQAGVPCTERILTPHDPGVRAGEKRGAGGQGDKVHVTETAEPDQDNFLTEVLTVPAPSGDAEALPQIRTNLAQPPAFRARLRARPAIEAPLSELVRRHGLRQHRYRGDAQRRMENLLKGAACNRKRLLRALARRLQPATAGTSGLAATG